MKKLLLMTTTILLMITMSITALGYTKQNKEKRYGKPIHFLTSQDYPGDIKIDGIYVCRDDDELIFTILYSQGELFTMDNQDKQTAKSSFFNPPDGTTLMVSWVQSFERIHSDDKKVQYRIEADKFFNCREITVFLYDVLHNNHDENISCYFKTGGIHFEKIPSVDDLVNGYEFYPKEVTVNLNGAPSGWARKNIEELKLTGVFRETAFDKYHHPITKHRLAYLMVTVYEKLAGHPIRVMDDLSFDDTDDIYALKATQLDIFNHNGDVNFYPVKELTKKEMIESFIKTVKRINVNSVAENKCFINETEIQEWVNKILYEKGNMTTNTELTEMATNEETLNLTYHLMHFYDNIKWYNVADKSRICIRFGGNLYKVDLEEDIILDNQLNDTALFFQRFEDINTFLNLAHLKNLNLSYRVSDNPNFKGTLKVIDNHYMNIDITNLYRGIDKLGTQTTVNLKSEYVEDELTVTVNTIDGLGSIFYGYSKINYYDTNGDRNQMNVIPVKEVFHSLGIDYSIEYIREWDIYVIEFIT